MIQVEKVFSILDCEEHGIGFVFYEVIDHRTTFRCVIGAKTWTEDTIISTCSHEAIEMVLAVFMAIDKEDYAIHNVIGYYAGLADEGEGDIILSDEHYANNVDGLPNLPKSLYIKKDIE